MRIEGEWFSEVGCYSVREGGREVGREGERERGKEGGREERRERKTRNER